MVKRRKSSKGFDLKPYILVIGLFLIIWTIFKAHHLKSENLKIFPLSFFALLAGIIYENFHISGKWSNVFYTALFSFILSFLAFIPGKHENIYNFESHFVTLPYMYISIYIFISVVFYGEKITPKLSEGISLLQSIAMIYWILDYGIINISSFFLKALMVVVLLFSLLTAYNAFTNSTLSRNIRLTLSIWSSVIMALLALDNIYCVYQNGQIENMTDFTFSLYSVLQYFLLGVCSIYIAQNFLMLAGFFPSSGTLLNGQYKKDLKDIKNEHIGRYSDSQAKISYSIFCVVFTGIIFTLNYKYKILPRNTAIWLVFIIFPALIYLYELAKGKLPLKKI